MNSKIRLDSRHNHDSWENSFKKLKRFTECRNHNSDKRNHGEDESQSLELFDSLIVLEFGHVGSASGAGTPRVSS